MPAIINHPRKILSVFSVLSIVFFVFAFQFREPGSRVGENRELDPVNPYWPRQHKVARRSNLDVYALRNSSDNAGVEVRVVFGIKSIDRSGTDPTSDDDLGVPVYQPNFDITAAESQKYIIQVCDEIEKSAASLKIARDSRTSELAFHCFMTKFRDWSLSRQKVFPRPAVSFLAEYREFLRRNASEGVRDQVGLKLSMTLSLCRLLT